MINKGQKLYREGQIGDVEQGINKELTTITDYADGADELELRSKGVLGQPSAAFWGAPKARPQADQIHYIGAQLQSYLRHPRNL